MQGSKDALSSKGRNASGLSLAPSEEGEVCSTCLEPYSAGRASPDSTYVILGMLSSLFYRMHCRDPCSLAENPAIMTKCNHHFHLACIYEWLERKQTCPICEREMSFEEVLE